MNVDFEAALRYIDLGNYDKAEELLNSAIAKEEEEGKEETAVKYRCVLGELLINIGRVDDSRKEFDKVLEYCDETHTLTDQRKIAQTYIDFLDGKIKAPAKKAAQRPGDVPIVPKPVQNKAFISRQMNKRHK